MKLAIVFFKKDKKTKTIYNSIIKFKIIIFYYIIKKQRLITYH